MEMRIGWENEFERGWRYEDGTTARVEVFGLGDSAEPVVVATFERSEIALYDLFTPQRSYGVPVAFLGTWRLKIIYIGLVGLLSAIAMQIGIWLFWAVPLKIALEFPLFMMLFATTQAICQPVAVKRIGAWLKKHTSDARACKILQGLMHARDADFRDISRFVYEDRQRDQQVLS